MSSERLAAPDDGAFMRRALALAERGWGRTAPNPMVGAVVVRDGVVVGEGWHAEYGGPHAEVEALRAAGELRARRDGVRHARAVQSPRQDAAVHRRAARRRRAPRRRRVRAIRTPSRAAAPSGCAPRASRSTIGVEESRGARAQRALLPRARERPAVRDAQARALARRRDRRSHAPAGLAHRRGGAPRSASASRRRGRRSPSASAPCSPTIPQLTVRDGAARRASRPLRVVFDALGAPAAGRRASPARPRDVPVVVVCRAPDPAHAAALETLGVDAHPRRHRSATRSSPSGSAGVRSLLVEGGAALAGGPRPGRTGRPAGYLSGTPRSRGRFAQRVRHRHGGPGGRRATLAARRVAARSGTTR